MSELQYLQVEDVAPHVVQVTVNRPDALNALNAGVLTELKQVADELGDRPRGEVRAVILTGAGRAFVAGADIKAMLGMTPDQAEEFAELGHAAMNAIADIPCPVIGAINGFALGGGLELALACDLLYGSTKARMGLPEVGLGLIPGFGGTQRLGRLVGYHLARELVFTGRHIKADEAKQRGLLLDVFEPDELLAKVLETAKAIAGRGPLAVRAAKRAVEKGRDQDIATALETEVNSFQALFAADEPKQGMTAFVEKRDPAF